jgi:plastocyanin
MVSDKVKKFGVMAALSVLASMALVACGGEAASTSAPEAAPTNTVVASAPATPDTTADNMQADSVAPSGDVQEVAVTLKEWAIEPAHIEVKAGQVRFTVENVGQFAHNMTFQIEGAGNVAKTKNFKTTDGPQVLEVDLEPGTYKMMCDIIGHPEQGMVGTLTVK